jgi:antirestriction protein
MNAKLKPDQKIQVYVSTYHKYNSGSLAGEWVDVELFKDKDQFLEYCQELHKDEQDPELMYQDYEGFPECYYSESGIDEDLWDWLDLDEDDRLILSLYRDHCGGNPSIDDARDAFHGAYTSLEYYVVEYWEQCGDFKPSDNWWHPTNYIDWERMGEDLERSGDIWTVEHEGQVYVFSNC